MRHHINIGASVLFALLLSLSLAAPAATSARSTATLTVKSPANGATVSGAIAITGTSGSSIKNVRAYLGNTPISPDVTPSGGNYSLPVGTTQLPNNATDSITVSGFTVPAGQSGGTRVNDTLSLVVRNLPPSPSDTVITAPSTAAIIDAGGNSWTITSGGQIAVNGTVDTITSGVIELAYVNGAVWQENASKSWWYRDLARQRLAAPRGHIDQPVASPASTGQRRLRVVQRREPVQRAHVRPVRHGFGLHGRRHRPVDLVLRRQQRRHDGAVLGFAGGLSRQRRLRVIQRGEPDRRADHRLVQRGHDDGGHRHGPVGLVLHRQQRRLECELRSLACSPASPGHRHHNRHPGRRHRHDVPTRMPRPGAMATTAHPRARHGRPLRMPRAQ